MKNLRIVVHDVRMGIWNVSWLTWSSCQAPLQRGGSITQPRLQETMALEILIILPYLELIVWKDNKQSVEIPSQMCLNFKIMEDTKFKLV